MVERHLAMVKVAGSSPVSRSNLRGFRAHHLVDQDARSKGSRLFESVWVLIPNVFRNAGMVEFGRHKGLKIPRASAHAGSSPALGTSWVCIPNGREDWLRTNTVWVRIPPHLPS